MAYTTIKKPSDYFNTKLFTGNGGTQAVTGVGFQPDWVWLKSRSVADSPILFDAVRGVTKRIMSNSTGIETTEAQEVQSFDSDGFTVGNSDNANRNGATMVGWNWKAGTSVSGTTTGSGTGKAYSGSVSTDAGFSIIKYIGNGTAGHTIPHHLGAVPKMFIVKRINASGGWIVYHENVGNTKIIELHDSAASQTSSAAWNNTSPSSTTFTLGDYTSTNTNDGIYISYCFAEKKGFSKFGSFVGNGSNDGTFVYTGFKPAFILLKNTSVSASWLINDNKRNGFNPNSRTITPNNSEVENTGTDRTDFLSNGFKLRVGSSTAWNGSGNTIIYMAFAEEPLVGDNPATAR